MTLLAAALGCLSYHCSSPTRLARLDPVAICQSARPDSRWKAIPVGDSLAVLVPAAMQHPRGGDSPVPSNQSWFAGKLVLEWQELPLHKPLDSVPTRLPAPYPLPASTVCSAPPPEGWTARTFIWTDRSGLVARVLSFPPAPRERVFDLVVVAYEPSRYGDAIAILKSLHRAHGPERWLQPN